MNNTLKKYAELKIKQGEIDKELKAIKPEVQKIVFASDDEKVFSDLGTFEFRAGRKSWKYTDELLALEAQARETIKHKKKLEEVSGKAELLATPSNLVFTARK